MARWRLAAAHYINATGEHAATWEYKENNRTTGRPKATKFEVPLLLDPENPADWNHVYSKDGFGKPDTGEIIVAQGAHEPRDVVFVGDPTPDMVPLDAEAEAISAKHAHKWKYATETLSGSYADEMIKDLTAEVNDIRSKTAAAPIEGMTELLTGIAAMMKQNQDMLALIAGNASKPAPVAQTSRNR